MRRKVRHLHRDSCTYSLTVGNASDSEKRGQLQTHRVWKGHKSSISWKGHRVETSTSLSLLSKPNGMLLSAMLAHRVGGHVLFAASRKSAAHASGIRAFCTKALERRMLSQLLHATVLQIGYCWHELESRGTDGGHGCRCNDRFLRCQGCHHWQSSPLDLKEQVRLDMRVASPNIVCGVIACEGLARLKTFQSHKAHAWHPSSCTFVIGTERTQSTGRPVAAMFCKPCKGRRPRNIDCK